ncbi:MAG: hypothetical protein JSR37_06715 [Verrucomicrobia bacterium]|nr:hypothetical protein [Verrucomicrobiota bacterium]MBS0636796.1 hypothetical protein [Verrucomicrobiota bacterium]
MQVEAVQTEPSVVHVEVRQDGLPLRLRQVDGRIGDIRDGVEEAKKVMYWRLKPPKGIEQRILEMTPGKDFPTDFSFMHTQVQKSKTKRSTEKKLEHLVRTERDCLPLRARVELLETLRINRFITMYATCKSELDDLIIQLRENSTPGGKLAIVQAAVNKVIAIIARDFTKLDQTMFRDPAIELLKIAQAAVRELELHNGPQAALNTQIAESLVTVFETPEFAPLVKTTEGPAEESPEVTAKLDELKKVDGEYSYWKKTGWVTYGYHLVGSHGPTELLGIRVENEVRYSVSGLLEGYDALFKRLFDGEIELESLRNTIALYKSCIDSLQRRLLLLVTEIHLRPLGELEPLLVIANGCNMALVEARAMHKIAVSLATAETVSVCKAQRVLRNYLKVGKEPMTKAVLLYKTAAALDLLSPEVDPKTPIERLSQTVQGVYEKFVGKDITFNESEESVWDAVMQGEIDTLYKKGENRQFLPERLQTLLIKHITYKLFRNKNHAADGELELLVCATKADDRYAATVERSTDFRDVIAAYDNTYQVGRSEEMLREANAILVDIFSLQLGDDRSMPKCALIFASLYQRCFEFHKNDQLGRIADDIRTSLYLLLFKKLGKLAEDLEFPKINEKYHLNKSVEKWPTDFDAIRRDHKPNDGPVDYGYTILTQLEAQRELTPKGLESFLLRLLACCLYSKDEKEKAMAQAHVQNILEQKDYADFRVGFSPAMEALIFENTMNKILEASLLVGPNEKKLFVDGPVSRFMQGGDLPFSSNKVEHALYALIMREQGKPKHERILTNSFKTLKGKREFENWCKPYRSFIVSRATNQAALQTIIPELDHLGGQRVLDRGMYDQLLVNFGLRETTKLQREVHLHKLYTERV